LKPFELLPPTPGKLWTSAGRRQAPQPQGRLMEPENLALVMLRRLDGAPP
jgi:hypothetical protein